MITLIEVGKIYSNNFYSIAVVDVDYPQRPYFTTIFSLIINKK